MTTKKTTAKPIDIKEAIVKTENDINAARLAKVTKLAEAKINHDTTVRKAREDELAEYRNQLELFAKRAPFLCSLAKQLAVFTTVPTIPVKFSGSRNYEYEFGAFKYMTAGKELHMCVGCRASHKATPDYFVFDESGVWIDRTLKTDLYTGKLSGDVNPDRYSGPNAKEFMLTALDWEKQLLALVDSL